MNKYYRMNCADTLHDELDDEHITSPFCDEEIAQPEKSIKFYQRLSYS